jgi:Flp pilus assembly protein TadD
MGASRDPIQQVRELIKAGRRPQALKQVARLIEKDHDNPELWWLLANATDDTEQARAALDHLLVLQPNNERAGGCWSASRPANSYGRWASAVTRP